MENEFDLLFMTHGAEHFLFVRKTNVVFNWKCWPLMRLYDYMLQTPPDSLSSLAQTYKNSLGQKKKLVQEVHLAIEYSH